MLADSDSILLEEVQSIKCLGLLIDDKLNWDDHISRSISTKISSGSIPNNVPQILINRERLPHLNFDVELLGDSDVIIDQICRMLGEEWMDVCWRSSALTEADTLLSSPSRSSFGGDYCEGDGEMSVDCTRDSGLGRLNSVDELGRHVSIDSHMDEEMEEYSRSISQDEEEYQICRPEEHLDSEDYSCGACRSTSIIKCRKIRRTHVRNKTSPVEGSSNTNGEIELVTGDVEARMSMEQDEADSVRDRCLVTRRHLSLDSTRDSGIGDGSNSSHSAERHMSVDSQNDVPSCLASRLPDDSYFFIRPNRYIFPGAEVADDNDDDRSSEESSEVDTESQDGLQRENWLSQSKLC